MAKDNSAVATLGPKGKDAPAAEDLGPRKRTLSPIDAGARDNTPEVPAGHRLYWLGTLDECPHQNVTIGGRAFPRQTYTVQEIPGSRSPRQVWRRGAVEALSDEQVKRIREAATKRVVRSSKNGARAEMFSLREGGQRYPSDEPVGTYLYLLPVDEAARLLGPHWRDQGTPPSLM